MSAHVLRSRMLSRAKQTSLCVRSLATHAAPSPSIPLKTKSSFFPSEPTAPSLSTSVPGPRSKELSAEIDTFSSTLAHTFVVDYEKCDGNYIVDADGNKMLDVFAQIASIGIGYNNPSLMALAKTDEFARAAMNRPALGSYPPTTWAQWVESSLGQVRPKGVNDIFTAMCGSCSNEIAYKAAFMAYRARERGEEAVGFSAEELSSCMKNQAPGSPQMSIISFGQGFHGRLFGSLSTTRSKAIHKVDIPAFDWPAVPWPAVLYPLEENASENQKAEQDTLAQVEDTIEQHKRNGKPIAALIVEPIASEGGDMHASPAFFRGLREVTKRQGVYFIVDEVQTGVGATGTFWAHEKWNLQTPPDFVVFSKKMQAAGFYHNVDTRPTVAYRNYNTWMGHPIELLKAREIIKVIKEHSLVSKTAAIGDKLYSSLSSLGKPGSPGHNKIQNLRGKGEGTFIAWDAPTAEARDRLIDQAYHTPMQNHTFATQQGPLRKVGQGQLLAAFKSGQGSDSAGTRRGRPQSNNSNLTPSAVDAEIQDCLQLAATLDDDAWDGLDEDLKIDDDAEVKSFRSNTESPPKRRKIPDGPQGATRFRPYVAIRGSPVAPAPAPATAPAATVSRGRFEIPQEEREGLGLPEAECARLSHSTQRGSPPVPSYGGMIEQSPSSETAYTHDHLPRNGNSDGRHAGRGESSHPHHPQTQLRPLAFAESEATAYMPIGTASSPQTPPKHRIPQPGQSPSFDFSFSSPFVHASLTTRGRSNGGNEEHPQESLQPVFAEVQTSVQAALTQSLQQAQREWEKERRAFMRKIDAKVYNAAIALSKIASYPGTGVQHWFLGSYPDRHHLTGKTVQAIHNSIRQPAIVVADYAAATQVFLNSPWPKPAVNELVDRAETQYARKVGEKVTGTR
ncbi:unnamed protein product [Tilletia controversa]|nr:unnamed protein product [Tilletia controversa]CAD6983411.1 unnamed protein product [Tilletia controversa]